MALYLTGDYLLKTILKEYAAIIIDERYEAILPLNQPLFLFCSGILGIFLLRVYRSEEKDLLGGKREGFLSSVFAWLGFATAVVFVFFWGTAFVVTTIFSF